MENEWTKKVEELEAINKALREQNTVLNKRVRECQSFATEEELKQILEDYEDAIGVIYADIDSRTMPKTEETYEELESRKELVFDKAVQSLLKLSKPVLDRDKIIKFIKRYSTNGSDNRGYQCFSIWDITMEEFADAILELSQVESRPVLDREKIEKAIKVGLKQSFIKSYLKSYYFDKRHNHTEEDWLQYWEDVCELNVCRLITDAILKLSQVEDTGVINPSEMRHMTKEENKREREYEEKNFETIQVEDTEVIASGKVEALRPSNINIFLKAVENYLRRNDGKEVIISVKEKNE